MTIACSALRVTQVINVPVGTGHQLALGFKTEIKQSLGQKKKTYTKCSAWNMSFMFQVNKQTDISFDLKIYV